MLISVVAAKPEIESEMPPNFQIQYITTSQPNRNLQVMP
jgi:hypothetical protein